MVYEPKDAHAHLLNYHNYSIREVPLAGFLQATDAAEVQVLPPPPVTLTGVPLIPELEQYEGASCPVCGFSCTITGASKDKYMRSHFTSHHPDHKETLSPEPCLMQRYSTQHKTFFKVISPSAPQPARSESAEEMLLAETTQHLNRGSTSTLIHDPRFIAPWLATTRWHVFTHSLLPEDIQQLVEPPSTPTMGTLVNAYKHYVDTAQALMSSTLELVLQRLNTDDAAKTCVSSYLACTQEQTYSLSLSRGINNTPFHRHQQPQTLYTYAALGLRFLAGLLREGGADAFGLTPDRFTTYVQPLQALLQASAPADAPELQDALHQLLLFLWTTPWQPLDLSEDEEGPVEEPLSTSVVDPTLRFLIYISLRKDGSHADPKQVTPWIAQLKYLMRLTFLREIKHRSRTQFKGNDMHACDSLVNFFTEKQVSPFNSLCALSHRATHISLSQLALPRVWWLDREGWTRMLYQGDELQLAHIQAMFHALEDELVDHYRLKVLMSTALALHPDSPQLVEDLSNTSAGYSFLTDGRNAEQLKGTQLALVRALLSSPDRCAQWLHSLNGRLFWNTHRLREWLVEYAHHQRLLLLRSEMISAGAGRGTELTGMIFRSTRTRSTRNLALLDNHITMVRTYSKTGALTGLDKVIPHSLDGVTGSVLLQSLIYARPFAQLAVSVLYPENSDVQFYYHNCLFVNSTQLFTSADLTETMGQYTRTHLGTALGLNDWRHLSAAWRRKLSPAAMALLEGQDPDSVDAVQFGHSSATDRRVYGLSPDAHLGVAEDLIPLYLHASTRWQVSTGTVPGTSLFLCSIVSLSHLLFSRWTHSACSRLCPSSSFPCSPSLPPDHSRC